MKRTLSVLLIAILMISSFSITAFAEVESQPGATVTVYLSVTGEAFSGFGGTVSTSGLTIVGFSGVSGNTGSGKIGWASDSNVSSHDFAVTLLVPSTAKPGDRFPVSVGSLSATKDVATEDDTDGILDNRVSVSVSGSGDVVVIPEVVCDHKWGDWTVYEEAKDCLSKDKLVRECSVCHEKEYKDGDPGAHAWNANWYTNDSTNHWHYCDLCDAIKDSAEHSMTPWHNTEKLDANGDVIWDRYCTVCRRYETKRVPPEVQPWGDATPYGAYNAVLFIAVAFTLCCTTGMIFKRKFVK